MSPQDLVNMWLSKVETLRDSAHTHRQNGMLEMARGERLQADQLMDCATALKALLPPITEAMMEHLAETSATSSSHATPPPAVAELYSHRLPEVPSHFAQQVADKEESHTSAGPEAKGQPLVVDCNHQPSDHALSLDTKRQQLAQLLQRLGYQTERDRNPTPAAGSESAAPGNAQGHSISSCLDSAGGPHSAQPQTEIYNA